MVSFSFRPVSMESGRMACFVSSGSIPQERSRTAEDYQCEGAQKDWSSAHPYLHCARMTDGPIWPLITEKLRTGGAEIQSLASSNQGSVMYTACKPIKKPGRAQIRSAVVSSPKPCGQGCSCSANNTASPCTHITFLLCCPWGLPLFLTIKFTRWLWSCKRSSQRTDHSVVLLR